MITLIMQIKKLNLEDLDDSSFLSDYITYLKQYYQTEHPDDPIPSDDIMKKSIKYKKEDEFLYRLVVYEEDKLVGTSRITHPTKDSPEYETNAHIAFVSCNILEKYRGKGYGKALIIDILKYLDEVGITTIQSLVFNSIGREFCKKIGATLGNEGGERRLKLIDVNWDMIDTWIEEGKTRAKGVSFNYYDQIPDNIMDDFVDVYTETNNQAPSEGLEDIVKVTSDSFRKEEENLRQIGYHHLFVLSIEEDGKISGLTEMLYQKEVNYLIHQELTGVLEKYRGRGLGKILKARMLKEIKSRFPSVQIISTGTADTNAPMVSINQRLGFKPYRNNVFINLKIKTAIKILNLNSEIKD